MTPHGVGKEGRMSLWERIQYRLRMVWLGLTLMPIAGGTGEAEAEGESEEAGESGEGESEESGEGGEEESGESESPYDREGERGKKTAEDYRRELRRQDTMAKRTAKENKELKERLAKIEEKDKSEQEKAIEKARREGEETAAQKAATERKADRLESAAIRVAARGIRIEKDDKVETHRFADPDDAMLHLQRAIDNGDVDADELYSEDGRVRNEPLATALREVLEDKPYLRASPGEGGKAPTPKPEGSGDGGKGEGDAKGLEDLSVDEHYQRIRRGPDKVPQ